jgi:predicted transcriptional regulator
MYTGKDSERNSLDPDRCCHENPPRCVGKAIQSLQVFSGSRTIAAYVESEEWQLAEIQAGQSEFDAGPFVSHDQVSRWLKSWGKGGELKAPR